MLEDEVVRGLKAAAVTFIRGDAKGEGDVGLLLLLPASTVRDAEMPGGTDENGEVGIVKGNADDRPEGVGGPLGPPHGLLPEAKLSLVEDVRSGVRGALRRRGDPRGLPEPMMPGSLPGAGDVPLEGGLMTLSPPRNALEPNPDGMLAFDIA